MRKDLSRAWGFIRHVLSIRGVLQWTGVWQPMTAAILSPVIGVWSALKGTPAPVAVLIGMVAFVLVLIAWRAIWLMRNGGPDWLRSYTAELAGCLFAILVEIGETIESPTVTYVGLGSYSPDQRVVSRALERNLTNRLMDAYLYAREIGVLPDCVTWQTSITDVHEVRARIKDLMILSEALARRFPDVPASHGPAA